MFGPKTVTYHLDEVPAGDKARQYGWTHEVWVEIAGEIYEDGYRDAGKLYKSLALGRKGLAKRSSDAKRGGHTVSMVDHTMTLESYAADHPEICFGSVRGARAVLASNLIWWLAGIA